MFEALCTSVMTSSSALLGLQFKVDILKAGQEDVVQSSTRRDPTNGFKVSCTALSQRQSAFIWPLGMRCDLRVCPINGLSPTGFNCDMRGHGSL